MRSKATAVLFTVLAFFVLCGPGVRSAAAMEVAEFGEAGFLNIDYSLQARGAWADIGSGPAGDDPTWNAYARRNRLSFLGLATETIGYTVQVEYNGGRKIDATGVRPEAADFEFTLLDAYVTYDPTDYFRVRAGKTKHVLTREVQEACYEPLSIDRSEFIRGPFKNKQTRDDGLIIWGNLFDNIFQYRLAAMMGNDFGANKPDDIGLRYTGRVHVSLLDPEAGLGYRGTYLGRKKVLTLGAGYETQSDAVFSDGVTGSEDYTGFSYDFFYEQPTEMGIFTLSAAYYKTDFNDAGMRGVADAAGITGERNGTYWKAAYMLGKTQVYVRLEDWAYAELQGLTAQTLKWNAAGVNYYIKGQDLRLTLEYSVSDFEKESAANKDFNTAMLQVQARF